MTMVGEYEGFLLSDEELKEMNDRIAKETDERNRLINEKWEELQYKHRWYMDRNNNWVCAERYKE